MHTTKEGKQIRIDKMEDAHLYNCILMYCEQIDEQVLIVSGRYTPDNEFDGVFFNEANPAHQREHAAAKIQEIVARLKDYVLEASIRDIDVSELLQLAFRRKTRNKQKFDSKISSFIKGRTE